MWQRDAALAHERIARFVREAGEARLRAEARARRRARPGTARVLAATIVRGIGHAALATARRIEGCAADRELATPGEVAWHRS